MSLMQISFTMEEYSEYLQLTDLYHHYLESVDKWNEGDMEMRKIVTFEKALDDTIRRWTFVSDWAHRNFTQSPEVLKGLNGASRVQQIMEFDEPLCFDDLINGGTRPVCESCPLWHLTGKTCGKPGSIKSSVLYPWYSGVGFFYPSNLIRMLKKIKEDKPILKIEVDYLVTRGGSAT